MLKDGDGFMPSSFDVVCALYIFLHNLLATVPPIWDHFPYPLEKSEILNTVVASTFE